jgi:hypothetical protein
MWMAVAAAIAMGAGLVLGILAAVEAGYGLDRWTQSVQAHGRLQLWGFASVLIVALSFEFLARMNARPPFHPALRLGVPAALGTGALVQAAAQLWYEPLGFLGAVGGAAMLLASGVYFLAILRVHAPQPLKLDPQPWFIRAAAFWLMVAAAFALVASMTWESGTSLPVESRLVADVFLRGFVLNMVFAIAPRAFRGHMGLPALSARKQVTILLLVNAGLVAWILGQDAWRLPGVPWFARAADIALAAAVLLLTAWLRIFENLSQRYRGERYEWQIPIAWFGLVIYAVVLAVVAAAPGTRHLDLYQDGAIRHILLLGFMLPLVAAMGHIVLARFGTGVIHGQDLLTASFLVFAASWPMRVLPVLLSETPGATARGFMGLAGVCTIVGLALFAIVAVRTAIATGRPQQTVFLPPR